MFAQSQSPDQLAPSQLDDYLAQGWFRMMQTIFTTNFIRNKNKIHSTIWLRHVLKSYVTDPVGIKLFKRNAGFRIAFELAEVTMEKEILYARYKQVVPFQGSDSLRQMLLGFQRTDDEQRATIYHTYEITIRDNDRLIACGFFDLGANSAEGITSFYDPAYKKYSLGKYLIYLKIQYCRDLGLKYFYPGYFVPGNPHFDYKLSIGTEVLEYFQLSSQSWKPMNTFSSESIPYEIMNQKLLDVQLILVALNKASRLLKYYFFDANLIPGMGDTGLFDFPLFLGCGMDDENINPVLVFDVRDNHYHLLLCTPVWKPDELNTEPEFYSSYFLMPSDELLVTTSVEEVTAKINSLAP